MQPQEGDLVGTRQYETVFCIFLIVLAFLWRNNPGLVYPQILYLAVLLLGLNLAAGFLLRSRRGREGVSTLAILANCATITAILKYSGGTDSNLWVLYLLPIYTACILLPGRGVLLIAAGVLLFNVALYHFSDWAWNGALLFEVAIKSGIFVFGTAAIHNIVGRTRIARLKIRSQRDRIEELEGEIRSQTTYLEQEKQAAEVGWIASGVAHDLASPLTIILGTAQVLILQHSEGSEVRQDAERILRAAKLCKTIVSNVLDQARRKDLVLIPEDLRAILDSVLSLFESTLREAGIKLRTELPGKDIRVAASREHLQRLFLNLLSNAKAAMKEGGEISIRVATSKSPSGANSVSVSVEDTGPGIPQSIFPRLFKAYATTKVPGEGTGLGLFLCHDIALKHNGRISAENNPEGGARFILTLPVLKEDADATPTPSHRTSKA